MKILFANETLREECNNHDLLVKRYGPHRAGLLRRRLDELFNAEVLADMRSMPHVSFFDAAESTALALDLGRSHRLAFRPTAPAAGGGIGGWDWKKVDSIIILGLINTDEN